MPNDKHVVFNEKSVKSFCLQIHETFMQHFFFQKLKSASLFKN